MSDNKNTATALDDERRVKVLSPGQLVAKRFFRNRLAMVGLIILVTPARATTAITFSGL